jgi:hypothetical protein
MKRIFASIWWGLMKANQYITIFLLLSVLALGLTPAPVHAAQPSADSWRGGKGNSHMSSRGRGNSNAQWSADPERGWVRADERHERRQESRQPSKTKNNVDRHKTNGAKSHDKK